ncbi:hypothetical protein FRD01_01270 [Microvenator marinus]|uniref:Uncharacterized protein n=1 Tax=Microvenator marinus TaxID=2600177 RepID=A0A5B8XJG0_9DELT|nr:hypothetical protein FRD01_01270 [Microvenator marinus]
MTPEARTILATFFVIATCDRTRAINAGTANATFSVLGTFTTNDTTTVLADLFDATLDVL